MARIVILFAVIIFPVLVVGSVTADNSRPSTTFDGDDEIGVAVADTSDTQEASGSQRGGSGGAFLVRKRTIVEQAFTIMLFWK
ncbi:hypothetical protein ACHAWO_012199 [Cyclotella atomus]|uniref:Uncharacterized protein n=1 Tax=Cyclotella atomus TaxID=382360 RepID=A0ABD3PFF0_9STRA